VPKRGTESVLAAVPLFDGLSNRHLKRIRDISDLVEFMPGAAVVKEKAWARAGLARASEKARAMPIITGEHCDVVVLRMTSLSAASGSLRRTDAPAQNVESQEGPAIGWSP